MMQLLLLCIDMTKEAIRELVRKVKKLADSGIAGEAESAKIKYQLLCKKYSFSDSDFVELDESYNRYFIYRHAQDRLLLSNVICMILDVAVFQCGENNNMFRVKLTDEQYRDITNAFNYYKAMYDDYSRYLMQGIIARNAIGYIPNPKVQTNDEPSIPTDPAPSKQTNSEYDMLKLTKMAVALESSPWRKLPDDKNLIDPVVSDTVA